MKPKTQKEIEEELKEEIKELEEALKEEDFMDSHETHRLECETKLLRLKAELKGFQKSQEIMSEKNLREKLKMFDDIIFFADTSGRINGINNMIKNLQTARLFVEDELKELLSKIGGKE
jgi:molecular chaperone GrpE (heat shock protein)